jgi:23S rRNA pseudouridine1911/1915/1917 synthase
MTSTDQVPDDDAIELDHNPSLIASGGKVDRDVLFAAYEASAADDETPITVRFRLTRDLDKRLDRYLVDRIPFLSRTSLQKLIREQAVTVNGRPPKSSTKIRKGDVIVAVLPPPPSTEIPAENIPLDVIFEDDDIIVINKHAGILTHPARGNLSGTMINALAWRFEHVSRGALSNVGEEFARPGVVHRLDRHTSGVIVFAKTETAHWRLAKQFHSRTLDKRYLAVAHGRVEPLADVVDLPLGKHLTVREKYAVRWDDAGKPSITVYRVRESYSGYTLVELELKTGRTHQIRVHMSHLGWPLVGDDMYGGRPLLVGDITGPAGAPAEAARAARAPRESLIARQALHATSIAFRHPITNGPLRFVAPLPSDLRELIRLLRQHRFIAHHPAPGAMLDLDDLMGAAATDA